MAHCFKLTERAREFVLKESLRKYPDETGGILIGGFNEDHVVIEFVTGPGPAALHFRRRFRRDGKYSQKALDYIVMKTGGKYDYIGEWHSHPAKCKPSAKDVSAMNWIANNNKYAVAHPILGLCTRESHGIWRQSFYIFDGRNLRELEPQLMVEA